MQPEPVASPAPVEPAARSQHVDTLRGFAMLGILVMNIPFFAMPEVASTHPPTFGGTEGLDLWSLHVSSALFDGKMRGIFSMLFGVGLWLQWQKAERNGHAAQFGDLWSRRCIWLIVFGMLHAYLLQWPGDILFTYGICGLLLYPFRNLRPRRLVLAAALPLVIASLVMVGVIAGAQGDLEDARTAFAAELRGEPLDKQQREVLEKWREALQKRDPQSAEYQKELTEMRGGWGSSFAALAGISFKVETKYCYALFLWDGLALMLLGLALWKSGYLQGRSRTLTYVLCLIVGYAVVAPLKHLGDRQWVEVDFALARLDVRMLPSLLYQFERLAVALAHVAALTLLMRLAAVRWLLQPLAAVGRTAFSNYILQTVVCTTIFYGFGFGLFGHLGRWQQMQVVFGVWALALLVSPLWLRWFRFGPLEWAWRSLVHWRRQPMRRH